MFSKISRYSRLSDVVRLGLDGQSNEEKELRLLPETDSRFQHPLEANDRLDHLAYKFYRQSRDWWRIADANPEILSPRVLIDQEPVRAERFTLTVTGNGDPPWADLLRALGGISGVEDVEIVDELRLVSSDQPGPTGPVTVYSSRRDLAAIVTYNENDTGVGALATLIEGTGFEVDILEPVRRLGTPIDIPPRVRR